MTGDQHIKRTLLPAPAPALRIGPEVATIMRTLHLYICNLSLNEFIKCIHKRITQLIKKKSNNLSTLTLYHLFRTTKVSSLNMVSMFLLIILFFYLFIPYLFITFAYLLSTLLSIGNCSKSIPFQA